MLRQLSIKNYAIIDVLEINFSGKFNIITGETGAGKSILLGALSLILGDRADTKVLYNTDEKCSVEAHFDISKLKLRPFFEANELDYEDITIIRREINQSGKTRAFVNDTPVNLQTLKALGERLINLHNQHQTLELVEAGFQLNTIDALAANGPLLKDYKQQYNSYRENKQWLEALRLAQRNASTESDFIQFQLKELGDATLQEDEQEQLEAEQQTLSNVEEIKTSLGAANRILDDSELSLINQLTEVQSHLRHIKQFNTEVAILSERIASAAIELKDIVREMEHLNDATSHDPQRLEEVNTRLALLYRLTKKYGVSDVKSLIEIERGLQSKVSSADNSAQEIAALELQIATQHKSLLAIADKLHQARKSVVKETENGVNTLLKKVGMPDATFKISVEQLPKGEFNSDGFSVVQFLFSANKGFAPQEIRFVASGGELSRLMLCIKSLLAGYTELPTMIFDEIDTGISGEVAKRVGEIMKKLCDRHQIIAITHLPQMATAGDTHFYIYKETKSDKTRTRIKELKGEDRVLEIAKMLSGEQVSDAALANARELISGQ
jgi:DNA repair protein RecN (Recombination protein N)